MPEDASSSPRDRKLSTDDFLSPARIEQAALRLISRAEQCSFALTAKLRRRGFDADLVKTLISELIEQDLLNDSRYAELWVRSRLSAGKTQSPRSMIISLSNKGIDRISAQKALKTALNLEAEYDLLIKYLEKKCFNHNYAGYKLKSLLKNEGFSGEVINRYFEGFQ